jgi:hypothetical protein
MRLLETWTVAAQNTTRRVALYHGDLSAIPPNERVDLLVLSAFPDDYIPTTTSLIGALHRNGLALAGLAQNKAADLRNAFSCWLSHPLDATLDRFGFKRVLCFEPQARGSAPQLVGDVFRAILPFTFGDYAIRSVAMPLLAAGDQRFDSEVMLRALVEASVNWLKRGVELDTIKIVVFNAQEAERLAAVFREMRAAGTRLATPSRGVSASEGRRREPFDCFVSYSHDDGAAVDELIGGLRQARPRLRLFRDKLAIQPGDSWQYEIDQALESCRKVIVLMSPAYLASPVCGEEFNMARLRHRESNDNVIIPVYLRSATLPLYMRTLNYVDCREADVRRIREACSMHIAPVFA